MNTPDEYVKQAETLLDEGRLDEAVQAYDAALTQDANHLEALLGAASLSLALELPQEARQFVDHIQTHFPDEPRGMLLQGLLHEAAEEDEAAFALYARAVESDPDSYGAQYHYGRALTGAKRAKEALPFLKRAVELGPDNVEAHYALGVAYQSAGETAESIRQLSHLLELAPEYLDGAITLVDVLTGAQKFDLAIEVLAQAETFAPEASIIYDKRAAVYLLSGQLERGFETLRELANRQEDPKETLFGLVVFAMAAGELEEAAQALDVLLKRYPGEWRAQHLYAQFLDAAGKPEEALEALRKAHQLAPQMWQPLNDMGDLLNAKAQTYPEVATQAVDILTEACRLAPPEELAPRYNLILSYWNAGHQERAKEAASLLLASNQTENPIIEQTRQVLEAMQSAIAQQV